MSKRVQCLAAIATVPDWSSREHLWGALPTWKQTQLVNAKNKTKTTKTVLIEDMNLWTETKDKQLFKYCKLHLEPGRRHAMYGGHGCGKSSLFKAMANGDLLKQGFPKHMSVVHQQEIETSPANGTIMETVMEAHPLLYTLRICKKKLQEAIASGAKGAFGMDGLTENLKFVDFELTMLKSDTAEERAARMLLPLGFDAAAQQKPVNSLSGGLRMRVSLVCGFFAQPDLLLLDEPTNHLDFPSVLWLEGRLRSYRGSFIVVTHDRDLLENVCNSVMYIEEKEITYYKMGWARYEQVREKQEAQKYKDCEKFIQMNRNIDPFSPKGRVMRKYREWMDHYHKHKVAVGDMFTFPAPKKLKGYAEDTPKDEIKLITMKDVTFKYPGTDAMIFKKKTNVEITLDSRMGVMGPNGAGKSTFLKLLSGRLSPTTGTVTRAEGFKLAYFGQHTAEELDMETTPIEHMIKMFPKASEGKMRAHLEKAGIRGEMGETPMEGFSGGQKSRVIFAQLTYKCPHLLILDEPTNFLDLESVDSLITACNKYQGAMLLVTHSRIMLRQCGNMYLSITPGRFQFFEEIEECEKATYKFINDMEAGEKVKIKSVIGGSGEVGDVDEEADEGFSQAAIMRRRAAAKAALLEEKVEEKVVKKVKSKATSTLKVGDACLAFWKDDNAYYPAKVLQTSKKTDRVVVCFVQYGNSMACVAKELKPATPEAQAIVDKFAPAKKAPANKNANKNKSKNQRGRTGGRRGA
jgi:ATPase subunit of ABC transporter with duplicated ATPase domains